MRPLSNIRSKFREQAEVLDSYIYQGQHVVINKDLSVKIDEEFIDVDLKSLEEARQYIKTHIDTTEIIKEVHNLIPEEKVASLIKKYHEVNKITDTIVESYIELASSNIFSIDPVITEIKKYSPSSFQGKLEYTLNDDSVVAISEHTQERLNKILVDKHDIIDYMRESKENFMHVIKALEE